jgi:(5-formylfuran-3-yl)methyl phosphate transaminase
MIRLPAYLDTIKPFRAVEVFQAARLLEAKGRHIVHLEFGEPDFPTPSVVQEAAIRAIRAGHTRYTHSLGLLELREAIAAYHLKRYGVTVSPDRILVSMGTSVLMHLLFLMLLEPGDEVILADPTYACYSSFVRIARGVPVLVPIHETDGFQLDAAEVRKRITPRTRAIVVCSPANPTGVVMRPEAMQALASLGVPIVSDEIYHGLTYGSGPTVSGNTTAAGPSTPNAAGNKTVAGSPDRTMLSYTPDCFVLNGFSKYFAMTGWRLGYLIFPQEVQATLMKLHQNVMISAADFPQHAAIAALNDAIPECERYRAEYDRRRLFMIQRLAEIGLPLKYEPAGAFYCFAQAAAYGRDSMALALDILEHAGVAVTPGSDFGPGGEGYLRFSYANSLENIAEGLRRIEGYLAHRRPAAAGT